MEACFYFRNAEEKDIAEIAEIEAICFPPNEACTPERVAERVRHASECTLLLLDRETNRIAGFLAGIAADAEEFDDSFFTDIEKHRPEGKHVFLLGLDVRPEYRHRGLASCIVREYRDRQKEAGRKAMLLTCHDHLLGFYSGLGFTDLGISGSVWGGEVWHEMKMEL